jgi:uncharacterized protein
LYYFDTSFLAPLVRGEESSSRVARFMAGLPAGELAISRWTQLELASLLARDVRMRAIRGEQALAAEALFEEVVGESFIVLLPDAEDYDLARRYLQRYGTGLRVGDALHLAIAANYRVEAVYSLDQTMVEAGRVLGLPVSVGIRDE